MTNQTFDLITNAGLQTASLIVSTEEQKKAQEEV